MQNFSEQQQLPAIRDEDASYTAAGCGRVALVDADDIADAAVATPLDPAPPNREHVRTGPRALSYDEAAAIIAAASSRPVVHRPLSEEQLRLRWEQHGLPPDYAASLAAMDAAIAGGAEDRVTGDVEALADRRPISLEAFAAGSRTAWQPTWPHPAPPLRRALALAPVSAFRRAPPCCRAA